MQCPIVMLIISALREAAVRLCEFAEFVCLV